MSDVIFKDNSQKFLDELAVKQRRFAIQAGLKLEEAAKKNITEFTYEGKEHPGYVDTGRARNSINHAYTVFEGEIVIYIGSNVSYFAYLEVGTGIYATDGKGRKSPWLWKDKNGDVHQTRGMRPSHALQNAISDNANLLKTMLIDILKE